MAVFAANVTEKTVGLINQILKTNGFVKFSLQNKLNLSDNTILIRLSLINLLENIPNNENVLQYKAALLRPHEFDDFLKQKLEDGSNVS